LIKTQAYTITKFFLLVLNNFYYFCDFSKDVRIGPEKVTDPAFLVSRNLEDHIDWMDKSKIKQKILEYKDKMDDYDVNEWFNWKIYVQKNKQRRCVCNY